MKTNSTHTQRLSPEERDTSCSIIALDKFIQATRDSGYKGTPSAVAELVDNAIQAAAKTVQISIRPSSQGSRYPLEMSVLDDGCGMDPFTLRQALRFGGSSRFNQRTGLGRFGMGLPNSSFSQARKVTVYTWQTGSDVFASYLDVDEIAEGTLSQVPLPWVADYPDGVRRSSAGTLVIWSNCDRLDNRRVSTVHKKLARELGQRFRYFLWDGVQILINGEPVEPFDPLYLRGADAEQPGSQYGETIEYEIAVDPSDPQSPVGRVHVTFSELPVWEWHKLSNKEKKLLGVSKGAGVSLVREGREVDYGWFFMGQKRRENYDDWWRCEVRFEGVLDEAFGITHTKQQVRLSASLQEALTMDMEEIARALNTRARRAHLQAKVAERFSDAERLASERDRLMAPIPSTARGPREELTRAWASGDGRPSLEAGPAANAAVRLAESALKCTDFFTYDYLDEKMVLVLNPDHPFHRQVYRKLAEGDSDLERQLRTKLELLLLSYARAGLTNAEEGSAVVLKEQLRLWSGVLATYLNG